MRRVASIHRIADKVGSRKLVFGTAHNYTDRALAHRVFVSLLHLAGRGLLHRWIDIHPHGVTKLSAEEPLPESLGALGLQLLTQPAGFLLSLFALLNELLNLLPCLFGALLFLSRPLSFRPSKRPSSRSRAATLSIHSRTSEGSSRAAPRVGG